MKYFNKNNTCNSIICGKCGRHLYNDDIVFVPLYGWEIEACDDCVTNENEYDCPMTIEEYKENGYYSSYVDYAIDDMK